tara:strand:+ start:856 stop:1110 length:255 start_codon:yes stop_codon:yes gene_type:complete
LPSTRFLIVSLTAIEAGCITALTALIAAQTITAVVGGCGLVLVAAFYGIAGTSDLSAGVLWFGDPATGNRGVAFTATIRLAFVI